MAEIFGPDVAMEPGIEERDSHQDSTDQGLLARKKQMGYFVNEIENGPVPEDGYPEHAQVIGMVKQVAYSVKKPKQRPFRI